MQVRVAEDVTSYRSCFIRHTGDVTGIPAAVGDEENVRRAPALVAAAAAGPVGCRHSGSRWLAWVTAALVPPQRPHTVRGDNTDLTHYLGKIELWRVEWCDDIN